MRDRESNIIKESEPVLESGGSVEATQFLLVIPKTLATTKHITNTSLPHQHVHH